MARKIEEQVLSFGEVPQPHQVITIVYSSVRIESSRLYKDLVPTDAVKHAILFLQREAEEQGADGIKNISIEMVPVHTENGEEVVDFYAMGTLFKFV
jgi:uncharacterized protein YbjQ (UPF0145 family)